MIYDVIDTEVRDMVDTTIITLQKCMDDKKMVRLYLGNGVSVSGYVREISGTHVLIEGNAKWFNVIVPKIVAVEWDRDTLAPPG
jgi:sRNA-binding regulator protein Hfq